MSTFILSKNTYSTIYITVFQYNFNIIMYFIYILEWIINPHRDGAPAFYLTSVSRGLWNCLTFSPQTPAAALQGLCHLHLVHNCVCFGSCPVTADKHHTCTHAFSLSLFCSYYASGSLLSWLHQWSVPAAFHHRSRAKCTKLLVYASKG